MSENPDSNPGPELRNGIPAPEIIRIGNYIAAKLAVYLDSHMFVLEPDQYDYLSRQLLELRMKIVEVLAIVSFVQEEGRDPAPEIKEKAILMEELLDQLIPYLAEIAPGEFPDSIQEWHSMLLMADVSRVFNSNYYE